MKEPLLSFWSFGAGVQGTGNATLLDQPLTAFFASRQCSGAAIRAAMTWAIEQARDKKAVISGFHSPLEQSVLEVMLTAGAPCVIIISRRLERACLPTPWLQAAQNGTAAIISVENTSRRLTAELASRRNNWVAAQASRVVIAHASAEGSLIRQAMKWEREGQRIHYLS